MQRIARLACLQALQVCGALVGERRLALHVAAQPEASAAAAGLPPGATAASAAPRRRPGGPSRGRVILKVLVQQRLKGLLLPRGVRTARHAGAPATAQRPTPAGLPQNCAATIWRNPTFLKSLFRSKSRAAPDKCLRSTVLKGDIVPLPYLLELTKLALRRGWRGTATMLRVGVVLSVGGLLLFGTATTLIMKIGAAETENAGLEQRATP